MAKTNRLQWNPALHLAWGKERLYFWRLFFDTYSRDQFLPAILSVLAEHQVRSFSLYETFGFHDIVLKAWLPTLYTQNEFRERLDEALEPTTMDVFYVDAALRHWPWGENTPPPEPDASVVAAGLSDDEILRLNSGRLRRGELEHYEAAKLIARATKTRGLKFIILVSDFQAPSTSIMTEMQKRLTTILDDASSVKERSLYSGTGFGNSQFVIMGRVPYAAFPAIRDEIIEPITTGFMADAFGARTYTYLNSTPDLLEFHDELPVAISADGGARESVEDYLLSDEDAKLEVKGSAFVDLERWIHGDKKREPSNAWTDEGVLRTIVAFLNSDGGTLVVGALEEDRYRGAEPVSDCPRVGNYICCGIEVDYHGTTKGWDRYQRRLRDVIDSRIRPGPLTPWYTITREQVEGRTLCVIEVRAPDHGWYYLYPGAKGKRPQPEFYVREGNRTSELSGPEEDTYKAARRRAPKGV